VIFFPYFFVKNEFFYILFFSNSISLGCILKKILKKILGCKIIVEREIKKNSTLNVIIPDLDVF